MSYVIRRLQHDAVLTALTDRRVVAVQGARQVGKSTLIRAITSSERPMRVISLDDPVARNAALTDPTGFLAGIERPLAIDEIQRAPDLLLSIKDIIDKDNAAGQFLLTGSANILTAPKVKDALTGRAEYITLWPLAQMELEGSGENFVDLLFAASPPAIMDAPVGRSAFVELVAGGGYPEARGQADDRRRIWYRDYVRSLVERDMRDISDARKIDLVPRLLRLIASQAANLFSANAIAQRLGADNELVGDYVQLLETLFIVKRVQAWVPGIGSREVQREKAFVVDSGLMAYLLGANQQRIANDDQVTGKILENFIAMEITRLVDASATAPRQYHYRRRGDEIDVVLEADDRRLAAVEVKTAATVNPSDYRQLVKLRDRRSDDFVAGVVVYTGPQTVPLGDRLWAMPISGLWA